MLVGTSAPEMKNTLTMTVSIPAAATIRYSRRRSWLEVAMEENSRAPSSTQEEDCRGVGRRLW